MSEVRSVVRLYRHILRTVRDIPDKGAQSYYYNHANSHIRQHLDETDPERIKQLLDRGYHDVEWIRRKFKLDVK